jgi:hypothetical protein
VKKDKGEDTVQIGRKRKKNDVEIIAKIFQSQDIPLEDKDKALD